MPAARHQEGSGRCRCQLPGQGHSNTSCFQSFNPAVSGGVAAGDRDRWTAVIPIAITRARSGKKPARLLLITMSRVRCELARLRGPENLSEDAGDGLARGLVDVAAGDDEKPPRSDVEPRRGAGTAL